MHHAFQNIVWLPQTALFYQLEYFLNHLSKKAPEALAELKKGNLSDAVTAQLEGFAKELEPNYK